MEIEIHIPRPKTLLVTVLAVVGLVFWLTSDPATVPPNGQGGDEPAALVNVEVNADIRRARQEQRVLEHKEQILRHRLEVIENERQGGKWINAKRDRELRKASQELLALLRDKRAAEDALRQGFAERWKARELFEGTGKGMSSVRLSWPFNPIYGVSAHKDDPEYEKLFGMEHDGTDFPLEQGSNIMSPADGTVKAVVDNGYGYSYLIIDHTDDDGNPGNMATLFGHISKFLVKEGQYVKRGQLVAKVGGAIGQKGSGRFSTGPHAHVELRVNDKLVNVLDYLPKHPDVELHH